MRAPSLIFPAILMLVGCAVPGPPYPPVAAPQLKAGESWAYRQWSGYTGHPLGTVRYTVADVAPDVLAFDRTEDGDLRRVTTGAGWTPLWRVLPNGKVIAYTPDVELIRFPLASGDAWTTQGTATALHTGEKLGVHAKVWVRGRESVTTSAGTFDAIKIERAIYLDDAEWWRSQTRINETDWYAPHARAVVKTVYTSVYIDQTRNRGGEWVYGDKVVGELAPQ